MRFVIMSDGSETRWNNYMGTSKHLIEFRGEKILCRIVRLLQPFSSDKSNIIITSHNSNYEFDGCVRYEPLCNNYEIDRFTDELITDDMVFLYGDTYYSENAISTIINTKTDDIIFFGNNKSIVAIKIADAEKFRKLKNTVKELFINGKIKNGKGWQIYQLYTGQNLTNKPEIKDSFVLLDDDTVDINTPEEYLNLNKNYEVF